jgi:hypothetical protein
MKNATLASEAFGGERKVVHAPVSTEWGFGRWRVLRWGHRSAPHQFAGEMGGVILRRRLRVRDRDRFGRR